MTKKYDEEFIKQLVHAYIQGTSYSQLEEEYGVAKSTISGWVKKYSKECRYFISLLSTSGHCVQKSHKHKKGSYKPLWSITTLTL